MSRVANRWSLAGITLALMLSAYGQKESPTTKPGDNPPPPRSDTVTDTQAPPTETAPEKPRQNTPAASPTDSSSKSTQVDLSPPIGDIQQHPDSEIPQELGGTTELRPWNPHRAEKDIEVGDYYFKQKNYRGAESRYRDALLYKPNDAVATFRMAQITERTGRVVEAQQYYQDYLKNLPRGSYASDCHKALERLQAQSQPQSKNQAKKAR